MGLRDAYKRYKYKRYMNAESRRSEEISMAEKEANRYSALAKAEKARANYENARTRTYKAQVARRTGTGTGYTGFAKGAMGAASGALNALTGDVGFGRYQQAKPKGRKKRRKKAGKTIRISY